MQSLDLDIFRCFGADWALLTAGSIKAFNTMTISWGGMGTLWGKSVATVYVRPSRYTFKYMEENEYFTVSFFPDEYKDALKILGTLSGRDGDKLGKTTLTPVPAGPCVSYTQAKITLLCRKLYTQDLDPKAIPAEIMHSMYTDGAPHRIYLGEVVEILK